jgi:Rod binding domain-containing protein
MITPQIDIDTSAVSGEQQLINHIKQLPSSKEQLKKAADEFEGVFISKMFELMDKTVDKEGGIFGQEDKYMDKFKSYMFNQLGRDLASNPNTTFGFAKQIYEQTKKFIGE